MIKGIGLFTKMLFVNETYYISDDGIGTTLLERVKDNEPMNISKTIEWKPSSILFVRNGLDVGIHSHSSIMIL